MKSKHSFMLFGGSSHPELLEQLSECLHVKPGKLLIESFPDGEIGVQILENVRGRDVFVLQSIAHRPNHYLMELLILVDAFRRASARSIVAVIPYYGYSRQDRKDKGRVPITAKLVANLLVTAGVTRVLTMDLHAEQIQGFFDIPVDNLYARPLLIKAAKKHIGKDCVVVAPDLGSIKLARNFATDLGADLATIDKRRITSKQVEMSALIGDVKDRDVLLVDDMCATGGTLKTASWVCKAAGAKKVIAAVTHLFHLGEAFKQSAVEHLLAGNTLSHQDGEWGKRVELVSIASLFGKAIQSIIEAKSISSLFRMEPPKK